MRHSHKDSNNGAMTDCRAKKADSGRNTVHTSTNSTHWKQPRIAGGKSSRTGIRTGLTKSCIFCTHNVQFPARRPGIAFSVCAIIELCVLLSHARHAPEKTAAIRSRIGPLGNGGLSRGTGRAVGKGREFPRWKVFLTLTERPHLCIGHTFCQAARMSVAEHSGRISPPFPIHA